ncbi:MAG: hypothetical protein CSA64_01485 [Arachnia propionica]|nr:MAG: hypothetical protein CSA64_01485 [Arachnia propionica]
MKLNLIPIIAALLLPLSIASCSAPANSSWQEQEHGSSKEQFDEAGAPEVMPKDETVQGDYQESGTAQQEQPADTPPILGERQIARSGSVTLAVEENLAASKELRELVSNLDGMILNEYQTFYEDSASATLEVSVPADRFEEAMDKISELGELRAKTVTADDVTTQVVDVESRIKTLRQSIARLQELMNKSGSVSDIAAVEMELTSRQSDLEAMLAIQKSLQERVAQSHIVVEFVSPSQIAPNYDNPFVQGITGAWRAMLATTTAILVALGALLPVLVVALLIFIPIRIWLKSRAKRRAAQKPPAPAPMGHDESASSGS